VVLYPRNHRRRRNCQGVEVLYGNRADDIDALLRRVYTDSYYHTAFEIQRGINVGWNLHTLDTSKVDTALLRPWTADGKTFSSRIWTYQAELLDTVQTELVQSLIRGTPPAAAINAIKNRFKVSRGKAARLVHTESAYAASRAQKDMFNELDVEQYEIVATLDNRTSEICQEMDGTVLPMSEFQPGVTAPPFHVNCRSTTVPYFGDNYGERAARGTDGKTYHVPSGMNYKEWAETFVDDGKISDEKGLKSSSASAILDTGGGIVTFTGASGAIPRNDRSRMDRHAELYYDEIRKRDSDIEAIAANTDFALDDVRKIKEHVFFNKYALGGLEDERFDADYDMAVSWQRLIEGTSIQEMDIVMLNHELLEHTLMNNQGMTYASAHREAEKLFNYLKYVKDLDLKEGIK